jgi:hypothetical protein
LHNFISTQKRVNETVLYCGKIVFFGGGKKEEEEEAYTLSGRWIGEKKSC